MYVLSTILAAPVSTHNEKLELFFGLAFIVPILAIAGVVVLFFSEGTDYSGQWRNQAALRQEEREFEEQRAREIQDARRATYLQSQNERIAMENTHRDEREKARLARINQLNRERLAQELDEAPDTGLRAMWNILVERLDDAVHRIASYEMDASKAIEYPAFNDLTVTETRSMIKALKDAKRTKDIERTTQHLTHEQVSQFSERVDNLTLAIDTAEHHAKKLRWSDMTKAEQKELAQARHLLSHASNPGNPKELRANYYHQLNRVIKRLNQMHGATMVPAKALEVISTAERLLQIESGNSSEMVAA